MSAESLQKIAQTFLADVNAACTEGRGEELVLTYHRTIGSNFAETVFLSISAKRERATAKTAHWFSRWIESFAHQVSLELVEGIRECFLSSGYPLGPISDRCEAATVAGFTTRFYSLLGARHEGGSA